MDFGLGLVLSFTDNASTGMNNAVNNLNNLTTVAENATKRMDVLGNSAILASTAFAANQIGGTLLKAGTGITSLFSSLFTRIQATGQEYEDFNITLEALYGNASEAEKALQKLMDFSVKSPLEVGDVKDFLITLKSQGIDPFTEITGEISKTRQETLAWITDLRAFKPDVALQRFKNMITNYVGSGEDKMIRTVLDMGDIEQVLGRKMGDTPAERLQDLVDFTDIKGLAGLGNNLANTWTGVMSNVDDAFTKLFKTISDNGVFEKLKDSFMTLAQVIVSMPDSDIQALGKTIAEALNMIVTPIQQAVKGAAALLSGMTKLAKTQPQLLKYGIVFSAIAGGMLIFGGIAFKLISTLAAFTLVMEGFGSAFTGAGALLGKGLLSIVSFIAPLIIAIALLKTVWENDLGGLKTAVTGFAGHVSQMFTTATSAVNGSILDCLSTYNRLRNLDEPWSQATAGLMRFYGAFKFLAEAWNGNTLSEDSFIKAQELGLLPFIETILDVKYRWENFKEGFKHGWDEILSKIQGAAGSLFGKFDFSGIFDKAVDGITSLFSVFNSESTNSGTILGKFVELLKSFSDGGASAKNNGAMWKSIGENIAPLSADAGLLLVTFFAFGKVTKIIKGVLDAILPFSLVFGGLGGAFSGFTGLLASLPALAGKVIPSMSGLGTILMALLSFLGSTFANEFGLMLSSGIGKTALSLAGTAITNLLNSIGVFLVTGLPSIFSIIGSNIVPLISGLAGSMFTGFVTLLTAISPKLVPLLGSVFNVLFSNVGGLLSGLAGMFAPVAAILGHSFLKAFWRIGSFALPLIGNLGKLLVTVFTASIGGIPVALITAIGLGIAALIAAVTGSNDDVNKVFQGIWDKIPGPLQNVILGVISFLQTAFWGLVDRLGIREQVEQVIGFISAVLPKVQEIGNNVINAIIIVVGWIRNIFENTLKPIFTTVIEVIRNAWDSWLGDLISNIMEFAGKIFGIVGGIIDFIVENVLPVVTPIIQKIIEIVGKVANRIGKFINGIMKVLNSIIDFIQNVFKGDWEGAFGDLKDIVDTVVGGIKTVWNGIKDFMSPVIEWIGDKIGWIKDTVGGAWSKFKNWVTGGDKDDEAEVKASVTAKGKVPAMATGGIVDSPTLSLVGEAGKEAVLPLENNTGWMDSLAKKMGAGLQPPVLKQSGNEDIQYQLKMMSLLASCTQALKIISSLATQAAHEDETSVKITPVNPDDGNNYPGSVDNSIVTTTTNTDSHRTYEIDNRVIFNEGSIVIKPVNASQEECIRMAKYIMNYIKRQKEIEDIYNYAD